MQNFNFNILFTSDVHGYIYPYKYSDGSKSLDGFSRIHTILNKIRNENTILIDGGDLIQGSVLTYYHSKFHNETANPMAKVLNHLNYTYNLIGNHEFNYGQQYLNNFTNSFKGTTLCNNIFKNDNTLYSPYVIHKFENGIKIAIIGTTTQHIEVWENDKNIENLSFTNAFLQTKKTVEHIKTTEEVDSIVVAYHGGFEKNLETGENLIGETGENTGYRMLKELDIDVLFTGHQHRVLCGEKFNTSYLQPGLNGSHIASVDFNFDYKNGKWVKQSIKPNLIPVGESNPSQSIMDLNIDIENETQKWLDSELGYLKNGDMLFCDPFLDRLNKHKMFDLINNIQMETSNVDISCCSLGNDVKGFNKSISMRDIISTYVYPNVLYVLSLTGKQLLEALEQNADFFSLDDKGKVEINKRFLEPKVELYNYDVYSGIDYTINLKETIGNRITNVTYQGNPIDLNKNYKVVMNNYRACGGGGFDIFLNATIVKTIEMDMIDIIANYIEKHKEIIVPENNNIHFII